MSDTQEDPAITQEHLRQIFDVLDHNGDGSLNIQELRQGLAPAGLSRRTQSLFQVLDTDQLGVVDWDHFKKVGSGFLNAMQENEGGNNSNSGSSDDESDNEGDSTEVLEVLVPAESVEQHDIVNDIRARQWERLQALQHENDELHQLNLDHIGKMSTMADTIDTLKKERDLFKERVLSISTDADTEIQQLRKRLARYEKVASEGSEGSALPGSDPRKQPRHRRASYVQRLNSDVEELHQSKQRLLAEHGAHNSKKRDSDTAGDLMLLRDMRLLTKTNEELHVKVKDRECEYKVLAQALMQHQDKLASINARHATLLVEMERGRVGGEVGVSEETGGGKSAAGLCVEFLSAVDQVYDGVELIHGECIEARLKAEEE